MRARAALRLLFLRGRPLSPIAALAVAVLAVGFATTAAVHAAPGKVARTARVAGRGQDVRLRTPYRPGRSVLPPGALMRSPELVSQQNYEDIKIYVKQLLTTFPPDRFYYVGVGRTPGPIVAMLKNLGPDLASNFPSSAAGGYGIQPVDRFPAHYAEHIEALIPEAVRTGDRTLVLMDSSSGRSLRGMRDAFAAYRDAGGALPPVQLVTLGVGALRGDIASILGDRAPYWTSREEVAEFIGETSDGGHVIHSPAGSLASLRHNPKYTEHRWALYRRMARDADLDAFLRANFPTLVRPRP